MSRLRVCFEIDGIAEDEFGKPCPTGLQIDFGEATKDISYDELTKNIDIQEFLELACLSHISTSDVRIITPEEYDEKYGED